MGESQEKGASSSVNLKEKSSLLDFDIGKDFLSTWKTKSGGEDDAMDLDFGPVMKNKKKTFDFDKVDLDFNLDGDFGKISSFNIDMSDFDVSSPIKKDAKHKEKAKETSGSGSNKGKADNFDFSFDFNDFNFKSSPRKDKDVPKDQNISGTPSRDDSEGSRIHLTEEKGVLRNSISQKPLESGVLNSSNATLQHGAQIDSIDEDPVLKAVKDDNGPSNSMSDIEEVALPSEETPPQIPIRIEQTGCQPENMSSAGPITQETCAANAALTEKSVHTASGMGSSGHATADDTQEEVSSKALKMTISDIVHDVNPSNSTEQAKRFASNSCGNPKILLPKMASIQITRSTSEGKDTLVRAAQRMTCLTGMKISRLDSSTFKSSSREKTNATKDQDEGGSPSIDECQSSRINLTEDASAVGIASQNSRSSNTDLHHADKNHLDSTRDEVTLKSVRTETGPSKSVTGINEVSLQEKETSSQKPIPAGILLTVCQPEKPSSTRPVTQEACYANKIVPDIAVRSVSTSKYFGNSKLLLPNVAPTQIMKNTSLKVVNSPVQPARKMPNLTVMKNGRTSEANLNSSKSTFEKETKVMETLTEKKSQLEEMPPKVSQLMDLRRKTLSTMSLKRKTPEASDADSIISNPSKRLSESPSESRNIAETSEKVVEKEVHKKMPGHNERSVLENCHASPVNVLQEMNIKELASPYAIEDDSYIEKAEACSKELEDICNMLRKKHEEAKEILVRAIVNNNKLLMLNHPLYDEKIRMIQKFAAGLTLKK